MNQSSQNRRRALQTLGLTAGAALLNSKTSGMNVSKKPNQAFKYSLNMSTIRGQKLGFIKEIQTAAAAGFTSVEIWLDTFQVFLQNGGSTIEAKKVIEGLGVTVENAIGFAEWIVDDEEKRKDALSQLERQMDLLAKIGCHRIAAPPSGATGLPVIDLDVITERYRAILELGNRSGVIPMAEMWGGSHNLKTISQVLYVAAASGHKNALILLDAFHIYKGESSLESLPFVGKSAIEVFHINDYPTGISPNKISEPDRVYPGDGIAPLKQMLQLIKNPEKPIVLSLEVFNETYYKQDALQVAKTGLAKMKAITEGI
ncbi:sugar phosphate isomerase/epimerase family protein [Mucilaginibacter sp. dw_454]|uniref:sugar phosphate isomerase/epimerase family protein n=1 Tax=Mucilaginibacter sp. dw_454 TaxID=2720079 RepID=UPI001BD594BB|nr:sugar phosphate isomerase/epimerase family protein [Mucilaginibacter sp. dw_454]